MESGKEHGAGQESGPSADPVAGGERVLLVRLPCNPIFPLGPIYLADHLHKQFPGLPQRILDLAAVPQLDVQRVLLASVAQFRPTLLVFSWRDIQIYAPVDGRGGNPLQHSFEVFYARNPLRRLRGALGGLRLMRTYYGELFRNLRLGGARRWGRGRCCWRSCCAATRWRASAAIWPASRRGRA